VINLPQLLSSFLLVVSSSPKNAEGFRAKQAADVIFALLLCRTYLSTKTLLSQASWVLTATSHRATLTITAATNPKKLLKPIFGEGNYPQTPVGASLSVNAFN